MSVCDTMWNVINDSMSDISKVPSVISSCHLSNLTCHFFFPPLTLWHKWPLKKKKERKKKVSCVISVSHQWGIWLAICDCVWLVTLPFIPLGIMGLSKVYWEGWGWHLCCYSLTQLITSCIESWVRETGRVSGDENKQYSKQHTAVALTTCFSYDKLFVVKHYILQCKFNKWTVNIMFPFQLKRDEETKKQLFTVQHKHSIF